MNPEDKYSREVGSLFFVKENHVAYQSVRQEIRFLFPRPTLLTPPKSAKNIKPQEFWFSSNADIHYQLFEAKKEKYKSPVGCLFSRFRSCIDDSKKKEDLLNQ